MSKIKTWNWNGGTSAGYILKMCSELKEKNFCEKCGKATKLFYHHKDCNRMNNTIKNIQILCKSCHAKIHTREKNILNVPEWSQKSAQKRRFLIKNKLLIPVRNDKGRFVGWSKI